ncbi:phospholipase domain-containing protein, partial [Mycobacterium tuberculosis]
MDHHPVEGGVELRFTNTGSVGASFYVWNRLDLGTPPRRFTVGAGKRLTDQWKAVNGRYGLTVQGPAGFHRSFEADDGADVILTLHH